MLLLFLSIESIVDWIESFTFSAWPSTSASSSASRGLKREKEIGFPKTIRHFVGSGTSPRGPSHGNVGVKGMKGRPKGLASASDFQMMGWISSAPWG